MMDGQPSTIGRAISFDVPSLNVNDIRTESQTSKMKAKGIKWIYDEANDSLTCGAISVTSAGVMRDGAPVNATPPFELLKLGRPIHQGRFAIVCKAMWKGDTHGRVMALKCYEHLESGSKEAGGGVEYEIQALLHPVDHPNVLKYLNVFCCRRKIYVLMEYANMGSLMNLVERLGPLSADLNIAIGRQLLYGLRALHAAGFIHRNLKPSDILFNSSGGVKINNFSVAKHYVDGLSGSTTFIDWRSFTLEQVRGEPHDVKVDTFSFGSVIGYCAYGFNPLIRSRDVLVQLEMFRDLVPGATNTLVTPLINTGQNMRRSLPSAIDFEFIDYVQFHCYGPTRPIDVPASMRSLIQRCLSEDPSQRPSCDELLQDDLFGGPEQTQTEEGHRADSRIKLRQWLLEMSNCESKDVGEPPPVKDVAELLISRML